MQERQMEGRKGRYGFARFTLLGSLLSKPDLRYLALDPEGERVLPLLSLQLAGEGEGGKRWYLPVSFKGRPAEAVADLLEVGMPIYVQGHMAYRRTEGGSRVNLHANLLRILREDAFSYKKDAKGQRVLLGGVNQVEVQGILVGEPRAFQAGGVSGLRFLLALDRDGGIYPAVALGELATLIGGMPLKSPLLARGSLRSRPYADETGTRRRVIEVLVSEAYPLNPIRRRGEEGGEEFNQDPHQRVRTIAAFHEVEEEEEEFPF